MPDRAALIGVWKLLAYRRRSAGGVVVHPFSEHPEGRLTYDAAGRMAAQLMRPGRQASLAVGVSYANGSAPDAEIREAAAGFIAYYGSYDVEEATHTVVHHVQACLVASWVGQDLRRQYRFTGDRLLLSAAAGDFTVDLVWEREQP